MFQNLIEIENNLSVVRFAGWFRRQGRASGAPLAIYDTDEEQRKERDCNSTERFARGVKCVVGRMIDLRANSLSVLRVTHPEFPRMVSRQRANGRNHAMAST